MKLKKLNKFVLLLCCCISIFLCSACNSNNKDYKSDFLDYYSEDFNKYIFYTAENTEMYVVNLEKEEKDNNANVVLDLIVGITDDNLKYDWMQKSPEERKTDLKSVAELVIKYANHKGWNNSYNLYIVVDETDSTGGIDTVYDYETNTIWIPNKEKIYANMYEKYSTFSLSEISEMQDGEDFLIENDLAYLKHNELEYIYTTNSFTVYINADGEFKRINENDSDRY